MYMEGVLGFLQYILQNILRMPRIVEPSKHLLVELRFLWDGYTWSKSRDVIVMGEQKSYSCISFFLYFGCDGTFDTEFDCKGKPRAEIDKWPVLAHIGTYRLPTRIQIQKQLWQ